MTAPLEVLQTGFSALYNSEELPDCKLICGPHRFNLHKVVLASQSDYFKTAFKRGTFKEGETGTIELPAAQSGDEEEQDDLCDDPEIVKLMLDYFYHFDYIPGVSKRVPRLKIITFEEWLEQNRESDKRPLRNQGIVPPIKMVDITNCSPAKEESVLLTHAKVFAMAVKYQVHGLRRLAVTKFKHATLTCETWKDDNFARVVAVIFSSAPEDVTDLRDVAEDLLHTHFGDLKDKDNIEAVMCNSPHLTYNLLKRKSTKQ